MPEESFCSWERRSSKGRSETSIRTCVRVCERVVSFSVGKVVRHVYAGKVICMPKVSLARGSVCSVF